MGITNFQLKGKNIYLDTNIFVYFLEGYAEFASILKQLFYKIDQGLLIGVTSELTLAEMLVKPVAEKNNNLQKIYEKVFVTENGLNVVPVSRDILIASTKFRVNSVRLPDAIHLATASLNNCQVFLTNDKHLKSMSSIEVVLLSDIKHIII